MVTMPGMIGVLALQGSVEEHLRLLSTLPGVTGVPVKTREQLAAVDGLILPGGESTTMGKLLGTFGLMEPLRERILTGMPAWGTCAGMILLARQVEGETPYLGVMDITVRRNAYGGQLDSFETRAVLPMAGSAPFPLTFIRAPWISRVGDAAEALCTIEGHCVAARQGKLLATSFHPELTGDNRMHRYFASFCK